MEETDDIDYLHPNGKPAQAPEAQKSTEDLALERQSVQRSIQEADGHHVCSDACKKSHSSH